jgi:hypothetical protein
MPRTNKFSTKEDEWIARAWAKATLDPIVGNNQKGNDFWSKIFDWFVQLHEAETPTVPIDRDKRTPSSLKTRWRRHIAPECRDMDAIRKRNPIASGENDERHAARCAQAYKDLHKKDFRFPTVLPYLQDVPTFCAGTPTGNDDGSIPQELEELMAVAAAGAGNNNTPSLHTPSSRATRLAIETVNLPLSRPMGIKQAKKRLYEDIGREQSRENRNKAIQGLNDRMRSIENTIRDNSLRAYYSQMLQRADRFGNVEAVQRYCKKLSKLDPSIVPAPDFDDNSAANDGVDDAVADDVADDDAAEDDSISSEASPIVL